MAVHQHKWTKAELDVLRANAGKTTTQMSGALAKAGFNRSIDSVRSACVTHGIAYNPKGGKEWPAEHIDAVRRLAASGFTGSQIAERMKTIRPGVTRNAVISQCDRRGIKLQGVLTRAQASANGQRARANLQGAIDAGFARLRSLARTSTPPKPKSKPKAAPAPKFSKSGRILHNLDAPKIGPKPGTHVFAPLPGVKPIAFIDRKPSQCAWPISDFDSVASTCCGAPVALIGRRQTPSAYCAEHHKRSLARYVPSYLQIDEKTAAAA